MTRLSIFTLALSLCLGIYAQAQQLSGKIIDAETEEPIPYATVQLGEGYGTIANEEGNFSLKLPESSRDSLIISSMGYRQKRLPYSALSKELIIYLDPSTIELDEVLLRNKMPTAEDIIREVRAAYPNNYSNSGNKYQMFFRGTSYMQFDNLNVDLEKATGMPKKQVASASKKLDSLAKAIMNSKLVEFKDYSGAVLQRDKDSSKIAIEKATKLIDSRKDFSLERVQQKAQNIILQYLDTSLTYKLKTGLFKIEDSLAFDEDDFKEDEKNEFSNDGIKSSVLGVLRLSQLYESSFLDKILNSDSYRFSLDGASYFQGNPIYIVSFSPRRARSKFAGKLYISSYDFAILKADYAYGKGKEGSKFNMKLLLGVKFIENRNQGTIIYKVASDGKYHPYYVNNEYGNYVYLKRPLKFIENSDERNKVKFEFKMEGRGREKQELLILSHSILVPGEFSSYEEKENIPYSLLKQFEASVWQNDQIIEPLEEMKNFKAGN